MSNIRVDLNCPIKDGTEVVFRSPVDCSQVTGLIVYYPGENGNTTSKEFAFADAHGNNVGDIDHLFAENVAVKVILDDTTSMAFVQNADTNAYLEGRFADLEKQIGSGGGGGGGASVDDVIEELGKTTIPSLSAEYIYSVPSSGDEGFCVTCAAYEQSDAGHVVAVAEFYGTKGDDPVVLRGIAPGKNIGDAVNKAQLDAAVDDMIEELGNTTIPYLKVVGAKANDVELKQLLIAESGGKGINVEHAGQNTLYFNETAENADVILRGIAPAELDNDAVTKGQLNNAVGDIESALDRIIEIQNSLIGGEA